MMSDTICTGSHLNQRTFKEDEYWESFQSTLIAGQVMSVDHHQDTSVDELSTMIEEEITEENTLNMNIDAIPNADPADMFFDCPSFEKSPANLVRNPLPLRILSPRPYTRPQFYVVQFDSPPENNDNNNNSNSTRNNINCEASPRKQRPESARRISPARSTTTSLSSEVSSSSVQAGMRTGSLLVDMAQDFDDLKDHAQSTPKLSSDSGNPSSGSFTEEISSSHTHESNNIDKIRKTLDFHNADTIIIPRESENIKQVEISVSNKENFFNGKYSKFVHTRRVSGKPSPLHTRPGKVKLLAGYYQSIANESAHGKSSLSKSRIPLPVRISSQLLSHVKKSPQAKARASGTPTYQTKRSYKLLSSRSSSSSHSKSHPATATNFSSSGSESFLTRNQRKFPARTTRVKSCSDATNAEIMSIDQTCKSQSTGDLSADSLSSIKALNSSKIAMRKHMAKGTKSPMKKFSPLKKISAINNRRSVGAQLKRNMSPVKPVKELCKLFTPKPNTGKVTQKTLVVPKIVITHQ